MGCIAVPMFSISRSLQLAGKRLSEGEGRMLYMYFESLCLRHTACCQEVSQQQCICLQASSTSAGRTLVT